MDHAEQLEVLRAIAKGFDTHDLDAIMAHFTDDAVDPRGLIRRPWWRRSSTALDRPRGRPLPVAETRADYWNRASSGAARRRKRK